MQNTVNLVKKKKKNNTTFSKMNGQIKTLNGTNYVKFTFA